MATGKVPLTLMLMMLIVLAGSSMLVPEANAVTWIDLASRESNGASVNKGTITLAGTTYPLPSGFEAPPSGSFQITYNPAPGYQFVRWEKEGDLTFGNPNLQTTTVDLQQETGEVIIRAVYELIPPKPVGGVVMPTNKLEILVPYLALAGLVAVVSVAVVVKRRRD